MKSLALIVDARPAQLEIEAIPIRPFGGYISHGSLGQGAEDVEVLRPYKELFVSVKGGSGRPGCEQFRVDRKQNGGARWDAGRESGGQDDDAIRMQAETVLNN